ncbi:maltodextrin phosphorylase [Mergibacter septicus]|uniref:Alpha-1,4 glucan phosphorylase n=1 Tax=Mergibacter septicus TaxID=221402 RepID=A0A8D4IY28_9PAST|nr:glycogen/starch/alpha-glucan family phosphorylase [Mergibacter septicus]AWX15766.1 maltodextrin phosphorylase [Mergibacter septicus]QDJ15019.1 maltodextrin phosphorylase [Mergibacter septicus]UTU47556.1 glycogen/starch/alpha-glucan family phosphorylase [Mergibacter septicus]WMR95262.1 glycogen/starch/alpha-glucan family phosphorylase [Mergibacter septicus]
MSNTGVPFNQQQFEQKILQFCTTLGLQTPHQLNLAQWYQAIAQTVSTLAYTQSPQQDQTQRHVNYLSMEFLIGRLTGNNLLNLGWYEKVQTYLQQYHINLSDLLEQERDPALGNGGLGRLAACYLDSMATVAQPATGYGLHYQYGLFKQSFDQGAQSEEGDAWARDTYPWQTYQSGRNLCVGFGGNVTTDHTNRSQWIPAVTIQAKAYDLPVVGYANGIVQALRLWQADNEQQFDLNCFNAGDYLHAEKEVINATALTKVLYPNDNHPNGQKLRLMQQYFHCACSIADIIQRHLTAGYQLDELAQYQVIQLNDTHPTLAIPELMRVLLDHYHFSWEKAWHICQQTFAYTNHTLLPEALEQWDQTLLQQLLPRHFQIIDKINFIFHQTVKQTFGDNSAIWQKIAILFDHRVCMANLCVVACAKVNGVAQLHSDLIISDLFPEYHRLYPNKFCNVTNGITPRRWLRLANPNLAKLLDKIIQGDWTKHLDLLNQVEKYLDEPNFREEYQQIKQQNKLLLTNEIEQSLGLKVNPNAIFDVQIKRFHEYKRQHLNLLHIIHCYQQLKHNPNLDFTPRLFIFAGKAAPGYYLAKNIILAINKVAEVINNDPMVNQKMQIAFLPDYRVSLAEKIIPAADISEQISMAGKEASGTGNMKLALNGALTLGTLDGANIEIAQYVGEENIIIFGHTVDSIRVLLQQGYDPHYYYQQNPAIKNAIDFLRTKAVCGNNPELFTPLIDSLVKQDPFLVLADFESYALAQQEVAKRYLDRENWLKSTILNTARLGIFSSDRSIRDYQQRIWL